MGNLPLLLVAGVIGVVVVLGVVACCRGERRARVEMTAGRWTSQPGRPAYGGADVRGVMMRLGGGVVMEA